MKIHLIFHVSFLKPYYKYNDDSSRGLSKRAPTTVVTFYEKKVEHSNADRVIGKRSVSPTIEYLVKWKELLESQANWEPVDALW